MNLCDYLLKIKILDLVEKYISLSFSPYFKVARFQTYTYMGWSVLYVLRSNLIIKNTLDARNVSFYFWRILFMCIFE